MRANSKMWRLLAVAVLVMVMVATTVMPAFAKTDDDMVTPSGDIVGVVEYAADVDSSNACESVGLTGYDAFKIDGAPVDGAYTLTSLTSDAEITVVITSDGTYYFEWSSTDNIGAVIVKGGTGANVYYYPAADGYVPLRAPGFLKKDGSFILRGISNVTFCVGDEPMPS